MSESKLSRRNFLRLSALGAAGTVLLPRLLGGDTAVAAPAKGKTAASDTVRLGFIGLGQQAMYLLNGFLTIDGVRIVAGADVYDIKRERFDRRVRKYYASKGIKPEVKTYENYQDILARPDIDAVVIATPDHYHRPDRHGGLPRRQRRIPGKTDDFHHLRRPAIVQSRTPEQPHPASGQSTAVG